MLEPIDECIYEINDILSLLCKGEKDKWAGLANRMTKLLTLKFNEKKKEAIRDAIRTLAQGKDKITKEEFDIVRKELETKLGKNLAEVFRKDVQKIQLESYTKGHTDAGIQFEFNTVDKKALHWLFEKDVKQFWIGESYAESLNETLNKAAAEVMKAGLGRDEAGKYFKDILGSEFDKTNSYWELLSDHIVTRAREFGRTSAYEKAGIEYIKIVAVIDQRTSSICRHLHGRIIPVSRAIEQRDKLLKATSVYEVKQIAPWYTPNEVDKKIKEVNTKDLPAGVGLPPYHGNCRTTTVIAHDYEINADISEMVVPGGNLKLAKKIADKLQVKLDNREQLKPKEIVKLKELCLQCGWGEQKVWFDGKETLSAKYHYHIHGLYDDTIDANSLNSYNQKLFDMVRRATTETRQQGKKNPQTEIYLVSHKKLGLQIWFYDYKNVAIFTPGKEYIGTFHKMRKNFLIYLNEQSIKHLKLDNTKGIIKWTRELLTN